MVLSGWTAPAERDSQVTTNAECTSNVLLATEKDELEIAGETPSGVKRKLSEIAEATDKKMHPSRKNTTANHEAPEDVDEEDIVVVDKNPETGKKKRLN